MERRPHRNRTMLAVAGGAVALGVLAALAVGRPQSAGPPAPPPVARPTSTPRTWVFGHSVRGRALRVVARGAPGAARSVLVVGCIHGDECAGRAVTRRVAARPAPPGTRLWIVHDANPDGAALHRRQNARGVDLNRNFPYGWRPLDRRGGVYWSGPRALSEPESRALRALIARLRPDVTIWYHQHMRLVDLSGGDPALQRRYARLAGLPVRRLARLPGSVSTWQNHAFPGSTAFVVELGAGVLPPQAVARHAAAVMALARTDESAAPAGAASRRPTLAARALRPPIVQQRIPFSARRRAEMAVYSRRHYGRRTWRLVDPRVIVEHYSVTATAAAVYRTFAPDRRDPELNELPGTCAHFVVERDGTILQLVDLGTMCRHALGLNHTSIGIEHVGFSDREVLSNPRQLSASLRLTRWLRCTHGIAVGNVIGHAESLSSPYHLERIARLRRETHGDFRRGAMTTYRQRLARLPCPR